MRRASISWSVGVALLLGCEGPQRVLRPETGAARELADLSWWLILGTTIPAAITLGVLAVALWRGVRRAKEPEASDRPEQSLILGCAVAVAFILLVLMTLSFRTSRKVFPPPSPVELTVEVIGHQFWWEVRYPDLGVVTANELHLPTGLNIQLKLIAADVIHSFWVPQLHGKKDMIPGHVNTLYFKIDQPGRYRGQCAEFCGVQHALMAMWVEAEPPSSFEQWILRMRQTAPAEPLAGVKRGREVFQAEGCMFCHPVRGQFEARAGGMAGPDLTHLMSRSTLGAATIPNTRENLRQWILNPHQFKPGVRMPPAPLREERMNALLDYLGSLR